MMYLHRFISALVFTDVLETIILFLLLWYFFKHREAGWKRIIFSGLFASFSTIPYVWFVFPALIGGLSYNLYLIVAELFALVVEAILYRALLKLDWKMAFLVSFLCNLASCTLGMFLELHGIWFYW